MAPVGGPLDLHAERVCDLLRERRPGPFGVELERTTDEMPGVDVAEQDVGVGDRGRLAAQVVANRAGKSAGALWPGLQRATGIDPDMRAATGPDRKSTRLNSSHTVISYAVFCLKKKK